MLLEGGKSIEMLAFRELEKSQFDKFHNEIVEHIFLKGCEMDMLYSDFRIYFNDNYYSGPFNRRLRPFARDVRGVCKKWKEMIDSEDVFSLTRYWIARLVLVVPSYSKTIWTDRGEKHERVSFAKQMVQFNAQLANSRGCDLDILLASSDKLKNWANGMDLYSETGTMLKLMAYTTADLKQYCKQIVKIAVETEEPHLLLNVFALLSAIPQHSSRLHSLAFNTHASPKVAETSIGTSLNSIWSRSWDLSCIKTPPDLSHLVNLTNLQLYSSSWLLEGMQFPTSMNSVSIVHKVWVSYPWLKFLNRCQLHLFTYLTYLRIYEGDVRSHPNPEDVGRPPGSEGRLVFPRLRCLELDATDTRGYQFIRQSSFPGLETMNLRLYPGSDNMMTPVDEILLPPASRLSHLMTYRGRISYSWAALMALEALIPQPMVLEFVELVDFGSGLQISPGFVNSLRNALSMLRPVRMRLLLKDHLSIFFLLEALNLGLLQKVDISYMSDEEGPLRSYININPIMSIIDRTPNLTQLVITHNNPSSCIHFLEHISANTLRRLEVTLYIDSRPQDISNTGLLPNEEDNHASPEMYILRLCGILASNAERRVSFPSLSSSQIAVHFKIPPEGGTFQVPAIEDCIHKMLEYRSNGGAIRLVLKNSLQVEVDDANSKISCLFELVEE